MSRAVIRENIIRGRTIGESFAGETEPDGEYSSDVDTAETPTFGDASRGTQDTTGRRHRKVSGQVLSEFKNQKDLFSGPLLPSEVCLMTVVCAYFVFSCKQFRNSILSFYHRLKIL